MNSNRLRGCRSSTHKPRCSSTRTPQKPCRRGHHSRPRLLVFNSDPRGRTKWYGTYTDEQYQAQRQAEERERWATSVRSITGNLDQAAWSQEASPLDPPALLSGVAVVIISPRKPVSVGTVARACGSFECEDLRIVMPRQESYITRRHAKSASKGAQYILYRAGHYDSIAEATADCDVRIAFTRWAQSSSPHVYKIDITGLTSHPAVRRVLEQPLKSCLASGGTAIQPPPPSSPWSAAAAAAADAAEARLAAATGGAAAGTSGLIQLSYEVEEDSDANVCESRGTSAAGAASVSPGGNSSSIPSPGIGHLDRGDMWGEDRPAGTPPLRAGGSAGPSSPPPASSPPPRPLKVALVFGREELGMSDEEVDSCEVCCSVPIGRLQESLSLSHAVSIALCALYQQRLQLLTVASGGAGGQPAVATAAEGSGVAGEARGVSFSVNTSTGLVGVAT